MAIKIGKKAEESSYSLYKGIGAFNVLGVNPNKKQLEELLGTELSYDPEYEGQNDDGETYYRLSFYLKTDPSAVINSDIELIVPLSFTLQNKRREGQSSGKVQIIDKYGRTAWATEEELASKSIPQYSSGPANISEDYRPAYIGEESLVEFLKAWLNIPNPAIYKDKQWIMKEDASDSEVSIDMKALFKGNLEEIKSLISMASTYAVKAVIGVKTTEGENGTKQSHQVFNRMFAKNSVKDFNRLDKAVVDFQANGGAPNTEFSTAPLHKLVVESTTFEEQDNQPFGAAGPLPEW